MLGFNEAKRLQHQLAVKEQQLALRAQQLTVERRLVKRAGLKMLARPQAQVTAFLVGFIWRSPKGNSTKEMGAVSSLLWNIAAAVGKQRLTRWLNQ